MALYESSSSPAQKPTLPSDPIREQSIPFIFETALFIARCTIAESFDRASSPPLGKLTTITFLIFVAALRSTSEIIGRMDSAKA